MPLALLLRSTLKEQEGIKKGITAYETGIKSVPDELAPIGKMSCAYRQNVLRPVGKMSCACREKQRHTQ